MTEADLRRAIGRKRDGAELAPEIWAHVIAAYMRAEVDDAQMAALLMASVTRGLSFAETLALTRAFVESGETLPPYAAGAVDKHSSGGVGDSVSLIVVPLVAGCGVPVSKLSGRALGHTGGTLDKLEAVPGVRTDLAPERFFACVRDAGCAIAAQSARLVPADKRIYALRDRTGTVPALGLIGASIVSKKIATGAPGLVFDVKAGRGALVADVEQAKLLARLLVDLAEAFGRRALALVTDMEEPLGPAIGTGLETIEAREFLRGSPGDARLRAVSEALGSAMLRVSAGRTSGAGDHALRDSLESGRAFEAFQRMLAAQGAEPGGLAGLAPHPVRRSIASQRSGFVAEIDAAALGEAARELVAAGGPGAGIRLAKRVGDPVRAGEVLAAVYGDSSPHGAAIGEAFVTREAPPQSRPLIYCEIGSVAAERASGVADGCPRSTPARK